MSDCCPVCGKEHESGESYCSQCAWELEDGWSLGGATAEQKQAYEKRLEIARSNWKWVSHARVKGGISISVNAQAAKGSNPAGIEWVEIPAGEFLFGDEKFKINLPAYWLGKFPVTNEQYKRFIDANPGHKLPDHWDHTQRTYLAGKDNHPVMNVSWHDAQAFCEWNGCRLPTEEEWEKAARGTDGRTYPWWEDWLAGKYCNSQEAGIGTTTPVDKFPKGVSPYGVWDMSGNVWEWTASKYDDSAYVLRGGSWYFSELFVRASYRYGSIPDFRYDNDGFRCATSV